MIKKISRILIVLLVVAVMSFYLGPKPKFNPVNNNPSSEVYGLQDLKDHIKNLDAVNDRIKPRNHSQIIWADSIRKTEYAMVYLHGFSAGPMEAEPLHFELAKKFGCNLYIPRLPRHGTDNKDSFKDLTPELLVEASKDALAVGRALGEKIILISTSTGSTLSIFLAAQDPSIDYMILLSPNIRIYDSNAERLTGPWGRQLAGVLVGEYNVVNEDPEYAKYWDPEYHIEGLVALQSLLDQTMQKEIFQKLDMPIFCGIYHKNDEEQDKIVSVDAIFDFCKNVSEVNDDIEVVAFADATNHVLGHPTYNQDFESVQEAVVQFLSKYITPIDELKGVDDIEGVEGMEGVEGVKDVK
jgi:esterase/lipase